MTDITDVDQLRPSSNIIPFTYQHYVANTYTYLLNMAGYKYLISMIKIIYDLNPISASIVSNGFVIQSGALVNIYDGNLSTNVVLQPNVGLGSPYTSDIKIDFGTNASRVLGYKVNNNVPSQYFGVAPTATVSSDDITYVAASGTQTFRYAKLEITGTFPNSVPYPCLEVEEVYDANNFGGNIVVTLEEYEQQSATWITLYTILNSTSSAIATAVVTNPPIPNTATDLRIKVVQTGGLEKWGITCELVQ